MSKEAMKLAESLRDKYSDKIYDGCGRAAAMQFEVDVAALLEALAEQPTPIQSWKLVPVEPTADMWKAVNKLDDEMAAGSYDGKGCSIEQAWDCLLAAAPQPAQHLPDAITDTSEHPEYISGFNDFRALMLEILGKRSNDTR